MSPAQALRDRLAIARQQGTPFEQAWPAALTGALVRVPERADWTVALTGTVEHWQAAYERLPATRPLRALSLLADSTDREPLGPSDIDPAERRCEHCDGAIPAERDPRMVYCSDRCRKNAHYTRTRPTPIAA